ncbi:TolC family outer membrane protein [Desulfurivibrio sp. C05AmB]|uniref:TolC family outer membrane protein n=1 Tax=Desulfurivibrio sp. C05AmB TaxID=3374371 RepID=UPI00376EB5AF
MRIKTGLLALSFLMVVGGPAQAQEPTTLPDAVRQAITENPEVQATWYSFLASMDEKDVARGGYFPRLDLTAGTGWEHWDWANRPDDDFRRSHVTLALRQMVYDGFATRNEVARLEYAKLVRYYEVLAASERVGLETIRAYLDVLRYRELQELTVENYMEHQTVFDKVQERVQAGISRGVDLEQAAGRLALSEANRVTETSNLYDVSTRYLRVVGSVPRDLAPADIVSEGIPDQLPEALHLAFQESPSFNAAVENVRSAEAAAAARRAPFHPRVDLQARQKFGRGWDAIEGRKDETVAEVVLSYNLFAGGSDRAAQRQFLQQLSVAKSLREKECRDLRQTLTIAFNDMERLEEQLRYLEEHQLSSGKAREAYRDQFDIGQRTLLDLLDTENEYFEARRAYVHASHDYALAHARTLAAMGRLLQAMGVSREALPTASDIGQDRTSVDPDIICPAEAVERVAFVRPEPAPVVVAPVAAPAPAVLLEGIPYRIKVEFPFDSAEVLPQYEGEIAQLAAFLVEHPNLKLTIEGHTDNIGPADYNLRLSQARAEAVANSLVEHGVDAERLNAVGYGLTQPIADNDTREGRSRNRRVEAVTMVE